MTIAEASPSRLGPATAAVAWPRILLWTVLFQLAWYWDRIGPLLTQGAFPDTDDFQRLSQIRAWLSGQSWWDVTNYAMNPPAGADMHWSRLVDVPIAGLMRFFALFVSMPLAERLTAIVWPLLLLVATVFIVIAICRRFDRDVNPLLVILFTVTWFTAMAEYQPGRLDHHSVQIALFCLMLLGLAGPGTRWGALLAGTAIAASIAIGLDSILLVGFALAWIGFAWASGRDGQGRDLMLAGLALAVATPLLMAASIPPSRWLEARCDANSIVYVAALMMAAAAFVGLPLAFRLLPALPPRSAMLARFAAAAVAGGAAIAVVLSLWPQCAAGPYGALPPELVERWLVNVQEARGLAQQLRDTPQLWIAGVAHNLVLLAAVALVLRRRQADHPQYLALAAIFVISIAASFVQYRAMRIGAFAAIPFCIAFLAIAGEWLSSTWPDRPVRVKVLRVAVTLALMAPAWQLAAVALLPDPRAAAIKAEAAADTDLPAWKQLPPSFLCNREEDYARLAALPPAYVMTDINSGAPAVVFTRHRVVGGPYHRNAAAILDITDFFETDEAKARAIARRRGFEYVAYCESFTPPDPGLREDHPAMAAAIRRHREPAWLQRLSGPDERMHVFRVIR